MKRALLLILALGLTGATSTTALAQSAVAKAKAYYDAGAQAYDAGQFAAAVQAFAEAYGLAPRSSVLFSLAQAERRQYTAERNVQTLHASIEHFRKYVEEVPQGGRRADAIEALGELDAIAARLEKSKEAAALEPQPPRPPRTRLMISTSTKGAVIALDGVVHTDLPVIEEVKPGKHTAHVSAPGYIDDERELVAVEGTIVPFEIVLRPKPSYIALTAPRGARISVDGQPYGEAPLDVAIDVAPGPHLVSVTRTGYRAYVKTVVIDRGQTISLDAALKRSDQRTIAYTFMGAGAAAAVSGALFAIGARRQELIAKARLEEGMRENLPQMRLEEYNQALESRDTLRLDAFITLGIAGALGLTAVGLYLFDDPAPSPRDVQRSAGAPKVSLTLGPHGAGFGAVGRF